MAALLGSVQAVANALQQIALSPVEPCILGGYDEDVLVEPALAFDLFWVWSGLWHEPS